MIGWIKLHRAITEWEWYDDIPVRLTMLHFLLKANWEDTQYKGTTVKRGELITGSKKTPSEIGITRQQFRTSVKKLKSTNEITTKPTNKNTLVSIVNYEKYQELEASPTTKSTTKSTINQPSNNHQITTSKEDKNIRSKEIKNVLLEKEPKADVFNFKKSLIDLGVEESLVVEWLLVRKKRKAVNTETAFKAIVREVNKSDLNPNEAIKKAVERSWSGFKAEWVENIKPKNTQTNTPYSHSAAAFENMEAAKQFFTKQKE